MHYLTRGGSGKAGLLLQMDMFMVDRGADFEWCSQYPHEQEILFGPLTGLEMVSTKVQMDVLVVDMRLNINLQNDSIENVVARCAMCQLSVNSRCRSDHTRGLPRLLGSLQRLLARFHVVVG